MHVLSMSGVKFRIKYKRESVYTTRVIRKLSHGFQLTVLCYNFLHNFHKLPPCVLF